jgi:hypothetical protein
MTSGMEMNFDRATVRKIVEDHWRATIPLRGDRMRAQNTTLIDQEQSARRSDRHVDQIAAARPRERTRPYI